MLGFLNVYKPNGMTSHDVVATLRRISKIKQIGHAGTLDPFAEGVLPVAIGKATRLIEYLGDNKAYIATVQMGSSTTTYDIEGEVVERSDKRVTFEDIENILSEFRGNIEQIPPIYSAIKVKGKKLYDYARRGETVEIKPRNVTIYRLDILGFDEINNTFEIYVECSKGTYIRSLANDIGAKLGAYGHLIKLLRVKAGDFVSGESVQLEDIKRIADIESSLINPLNCINLPKYELSPIDAEKVSHGIKIKPSYPDGKAIFTYKNQLLAVADIRDNIATTEKVFV